MRLSGKLTLTVTVRIRIVSQATANSLSFRILSFKIMLLNAHLLKVLLIPFTKKMFTVGIIYKKACAMVGS